jgi:hypothetical protein
MNKKLIAEMQAIDREISSKLFTKKKRWSEDCNLMGCRNKPYKKFYSKKFDRYIWFCKKHVLDGTCKIGDYVEVRA